jgi:acetyltransferase
MDRPDRLFDPRSIAVIGASTDPDKRGYRTIDDLQKWGYEGEVYPVNPNHDEVLGLAAYPSVLDVPGPVDLAFVAIPAPSVPAVIRECGERDVAGAVINTAGFEEVGEADLEERLATAAEEAGVRVIGPNIQGADFVHQHVHLLGGIRTTSGDLGLLTQSGNVGVMLSVDAADRGTVGFSYNLGVGNETDLRFDEYLRFLGEEERTEGVVVYVEGMADGRAFLREARRVSPEKPVVAFKGGRTAAGKGSSRSHTAAVAGDVDVVEAAYRQAGVQPVGDVDLLVPVAEALTTCPIPDGPNVAVLTDGGGSATVAVDALAEAGLETPELATETQETLGDLFGLSPNLTNPVDVMGAYDHEAMWYDAARHLLEDPNVDALLITGCALGYEECWGEGGEPDEEPGIARKLAALVEEVGKPVVFDSLWAELGCSTALGYLNGNGVPVYERIDTAVAALAALAGYGEHLANADRKSDFALDAEGNADRAVADAVTEGRSRLSEAASRTSLAGYGVPVAPFEVAETPDDAVEVARGFDGPVAMKVASPDVVHKTEAGGVELAVEGERDVREAFDRIVANVEAHDPEARLDGVLVSPMVEGGTELFVGVTEDPEVGPVIAFGSGGTLVEVIDDVAFRALPLTEHDARATIDDLERRELFEGTRGNPPVDVEELVDLLLSVSRFATDNPAVAELDVNPVVATPDGLAAVDAHVGLDTGRGE